MSFGAMGSLALIVLAAIVLQPLHMSAGTLQELGLAMATPLSRAGALLFATVLFATCLGAAFEIALAVVYNVSQGFGWEWSEDKTPVLRALRTAAP